jgi:hypothetical protein
MTADSECPICLDEKELETLQCHHSLCLECVNSILDTQFYNKLSCPLCRTVSYEINNEDINTKIIDIELNRDSNATKRDYMITYTYECMYYTIDIDKQFKLQPIPKENPYQSHKIRNGNVVQLVYS